MQQPPTAQPLRGPANTERPPKSRLRQNVESLLLAVLVALVVRSSVVEAFWVPSGSMLPTIQIGDHLFVNKLAYGFNVDIPFGLLNWRVAQWRPPQRGDIVVFTSPIDRNMDLIKRVVAVAGDKVEVRNKKLIINGEVVPDPHAHYDPNVRTAGDNFGPVTVPPGKFFAMGDNRDQSFDTRYWRFPDGRQAFADEADVKGHATFIYWSLDSRASWASAIRWDRFGHFLR